MNVYSYPQVWCHGATQYPDSAIFYSRQSVEDIFSEKPKNTKI